MYLNGELIQTITVGSEEIDYVGNYCNDEVNVGRNTRGGQSPSAYFDGQIDEVRVIARALSQAEIQDLMDPDEVYSKIEQTVSTKYYFAGGRLAMRTNGTLNYLLSDHLGSTSITADANGDFVSEVRYMPWGETRYESGTVGTDFLFTNTSLLARDATVELGYTISAHVGTTAL